MTELKQLEPFVGEWRLEMVMPKQEAMPDIGARVSFDWMPGKLWLVQRWTVPIPEAPDGIAIIGHDEARGGLLQHYFDQRGVARFYEMSVDDGVCAPHFERVEDHLCVRKAFLPVRLQAAINDLCQPPIHACHSPGGGAAGMVRPGVKRGCCA